LGSAVKDFKVGERVMALLAGGGYAQYCTVPANCLLRVPASLPWEQAAAIPETWLTGLFSWTSKKIVRVSQRLPRQCSISAASPAGPRTARRDGHGTRWREWRRLCSDSVSSAGWSSSLGNRQLAGENRFLQETGWYEPFRGLLLCHYFNVDRL